MSEELDDSPIKYTMGEEGWYEVGSSDDIFEGNEYGKV